MYINFDRKIVVLSRYIHLGQLFSQTHQVTLLTIERFKSKFQFALPRAPRSIESFNKGLACVGRRRLGPRLAAG
jgi:hypothetical protein